MIKIPKCPECGSDTAPDLIEINILEGTYFDSYEEVYECKCGCHYVALMPRSNGLEMRIKKIVKNRK